MARFRVYVTRTEIDRAYFTVDADSEADAIAAAEESYELGESPHSVDVLPGSGIDWSSAHVTDD